VTDRIRVLVVDDSMVMRRVVSDILAAEVDLDVQPPAAGGALALARLDAGPIDVVILDVEMPEMSGLEVLEKLRQRPGMPVVIMFSASTQKAASTTLDALSLGASDYVTKPSGTGSAAASVELVRSQLLPRIRALGRRVSGRPGGTGSPASTGSTGGPGVASSSSSSTPGPARATPTSSPSRTSSSTTLEAVSLWPTNAPSHAPSPSSSSRLGRSPASEAPRTGSRPPSGPIATRAPSTTFSPRSARAGAIEVLVIGASTGGPNALAALLRDLPAKLPVPVVIVQHMPPVFTKMLAERLTATTSMPVDEATHGQSLVPGRALLAPGDHHLVVHRQGVEVVAHLNKEAPENSCRPSVDVLFRSVAATFGASVLGVVLTGMGQDGLVGCQALKAVGAQIVVQDEASSVVWGMPGFVARAGLADAVKPLAELPVEILRRLRGGASTTKAGTP
jgi:two-component system chemotaxis response regulator CheB